MEERIERIITRYLGKELGNSDAIPNLLVKGIADEINKHRWEIYSGVQREYDMEDIKYIAENKNVKLTDEEVSTVLHRYGKIEDSNLESLDYIIEDVIDERKKGGDM